MGNSSHRWITLLALATLCVACSGSRQDNPITQQALNDAGERDLNTSPTNDRSFQLLFKDDPTKFAIIQALFDQSGKRCGSVTRAAFKGGVDGTDEWRVDCADSGLWQVWFKPDWRIDFDQCEKNRCA
jgi:hypothetical protein